MLKTVIEGVKAYFTSFSLIGKLKLWKYFSIPILISLVVGGVISLLAYSLSSNVGSLISKLWVWNWGKETFATIGTFLGGLIVLAIGLILYKHIVMALVSPFMSPVSEKIEHYYKQTIGKELVKHEHRNTTFQQQLIRGVRINLRNLTKELFFTIVLLLFSLIPVINLITTPLLFLVQSYYAGFGNIDYTLERHYNYKESIAFVNKNRGLAIGNGIIFTLLLLIPIVGVIVVLPLSVTASSIKTIEKIYSDEHSH